MSPSEKRLVKVLMRCEAWFSTVPEGREMQLVCQNAIERELGPHVEAGCGICNGSGKMTLSRPGYSWTEPCDCQSPPSSYR